MISLALGLREEIVALSFSEGVNGGRIGWWRTPLGFLAATMAAGEGDGDGGFGGVRSPPGSGWK